MLLINIFNLKPAHKTFFQTNPYFLPNPQTFWFHYCHSYHPSSRYLSITIIYHLKTHAFTTQKWKATKKLPNHGTERFVRWLNVLVSSFDMLTFVAWFVVVTFPCWFFDKLNKFDGIINSCSWLMWTRSALVIKYLVIPSKRWSGSRYFIAWTKSL